MFKFRSPDLFCRLFKTALNQSQLFSAQHDVRLAWKGRCYTKDDFVSWYGLERGLDLWDEAGADTIVISFMLMTGNTACQDMVSRHTLGTTARNVKDHLRTYSSEDGIRKLDYDSDLLIGSKNLDYRIADVGDVFALEEAKAMLAATRNCLRITVIRKQLWE